MLQNDGKDIAKEMREYFAAKEDRERKFFGAKSDKGKPSIRMVPPQIVRDIAEVRAYGTDKYGDPDNWKDVEVGRYVDALGRHLLGMLEDPHTVDEESGLEHYKHIACNASFICEILKDKTATFDTKARG